MQDEEIGVADIGGTHARFALARIGGGRVLGLGPATVLRVADHASLAAAWRAFVAASPSVPRAAALAVACPVRGAELKFTNNPWRLRPADLPGELGVERLALVNDFGAVAHAAAQLPPENFTPLAGPGGALPRPGVVTVVGPGTGLGVAIAVLDEKGHRVIETEGGHSAFAPRDAFEDGLAARLRAKHGRVSVERVVSGPGLAEIRAALASSLATAEAAPAPPDDKALWEAALSGADPLSRRALEKFCACLGAFLGDAALLHGANAIVLAGGLAERIADLLPQTDFTRSLVGKGRYEAMLSALPVWRLAYPQPGLYGAAAAYAAGHG
jgi:glucokinase